MSSGLFKSWVKIVSRWGKIVIRCGCNGKKFEKSRKIMSRWAEIVTRCCWQKKIVSLDLRKRV